VEIEKAKQRQTTAKENAIRRKEVLDNSYDKKSPTQTEIG
jgi:hypothetical protein